MKKRKLSVKQNWRLILDRKKKLFVSYKLKST